MAESNLPPDDDSDAPRPKWLGVFIVVMMVLVSLGVANVGWLIMRPDPVENKQDVALQSRPELLAGKELVKGSDCMRCHGWDRKFVGPSFVSIAQKYSAQSDAQSYIAGKIRGGSVGVWGNVIMPRHPQISDEQSLQMAGWILAATPSASSTASPAEEAK